LERSFYTKPTPVSNGTGIFVTVLGYWFLSLQLCNCSETLTKCKFAMFRK
jgi:hypothetical protein